MEQSHLFPPSLSPSLVEHVHCTSYNVSMYMNKYKGYYNEEYPHRINPKPPLFHF